ncbi:hypothetical protein PVL30_003965 [Lodderomyces elongisporus]|uniref:uncharacterized protein n=1 Tax=Lodderomyces elongisporus TaxID=36914 RepID=UPI00292260D2|nr:uncharacterized protein PVL30_003965 [Lodderomyces elongisporus]WLF80189.1 hypothetical protein PVL30_003965 [Lodderomyces elongisporus]
MVLKNSKWDKQAKYKYMKKHGLKTSRPKDSVVTPKWSGKKAGKDGDARKITLEDSDEEEEEEEEEEWDSDVDEALINHFYPQLDKGESLTIEQKLKIKQQILNDLQNSNASPELDANDKEGKREEIDGIYLGQASDGQISKGLEPGQGQRQDQSQSNPALPQNPSFNLQDFINSIEKKPNKNKKLLKNKFSENFLEEYGLESYNYGKDDYNKMYEERQKSSHSKNLLNELTSRGIDEYEIGQSIDKQKQSIRSLTEEEKEEEKRRRALMESDNFYKEIKRKFGAQEGNAKKKVLELNNFNSSDLSQLQRLQEKLEKGDDAPNTLEDDLFNLLGLPIPSKDGNVDSEIEMESGKNKGSKNQEQEHERKQTTLSHNFGNLHLSTDKQDLNASKQPFEDDLNFVDSLLK